MHARQRRAALCCFAKACRLPFCACCFSGFARRRTVRRAARCNVYVNRRRRRQCNESGWDGAGAYDTACQCGLMSISICTAGGVCFVPGDAMGCGALRCAYITHGVGFRTCKPVGAAHCGVAFPRLAAYALLSCCASIFSMAWTTASPKHSRVKARPE